MRTIKPRPARSRMRCDGVRRLRHARADGVAHGVMVREGRGLTTLWSSHVLLPLLRAARSHGCIANGLPSLICRVVEESADVVNKQRVQHLSDLFLVCEIQRTVKRNPAPVSTCSSAKHERLTKHP